ncbi:MAG: 1,4-alpha-glucan branching protein GlgB [Pseudomonadota bacterium]
MTLTSAADASAISSGGHGDPFSILGLHKLDDQLVIRAFMPGADVIEVLDAKTSRTLLELQPHPAGEGVFEGRVPRRKVPFAYLLRYTKGPHVWEAEDPYRFGPVLGEVDEHLINEGTHRDLWRSLGAHLIRHEASAGVHFAVWAPNARRVSVVGDFNGWDGRRHVMRARGHSGVWEIFLPDLGEGEPYKFEILGPDSRPQPLKADPLGFGAEHAPKTASITRRLDGYTWRDADWMQVRGECQRIDEPISIYEVHLGSWRRVPEEGNRSLSYLEHASQLIPYAKDMGFTHVELMPISEFPFDGSWGYQPIGLFAPTIRYGTPDEFRDFISACHAADLGVIIDWVPGHFPEDPHGLGRFDGAPLYEHADRKEGFHPDWNTLLYNYGRREISNFLIANALFWLKEYHIDGLRVDAVASMLYRDYSRKDGEWIPNKDGGRENYEAIGFLQQVNEIAYAEVPGIMTVAEESTAFPGVTKQTDQGGLGFGFKWNMGWMNDTLSYMKEDPIHRRYHHHKMTFGLHYAFSENFVLPISHDEVVHGKGSMLAKMPGNGGDKFANLRAYYGYMWGHPGKKLLFMGCEFAQSAEWNHDNSLDWHLLDHGPHQGVQRLVRDLNTVYRTHPALYQLDCKPDGFSWIEGGSVDESVFVWSRLGRDGAAPVLVVCNFTPIAREGRRVGVPRAGQWREILNTDAELYGGANRGNLGGVESEDIQASGCEQSVVLNLPPLTTLFFELRQG